MQKSKKKFLKTLFVFTLITLIFISCKKKEEPVSTTPSTTPGTTTASSITPTIAISSPTAVTRVTRTTTPEVLQNQDFQSKKAYFDAILNKTTVSEALSYFTPGQSMGGGDAECYGPSMQIKYHPDDFVLGASAPSWSQTDGWGLPGGDSGIWLATNTRGEACLAAKMNSETSKISGNVDNAVKMIYSLITVYKIQNSGTLPDTFNTDLYSTVNTELSSLSTPAISLTKASLSYSANVLTMEIEGTVPVMDNSNQFVSKAVYIHLTHTKLNDDNSQNKGVLKGFIEGNQMGGGQYMKEVFYIVYNTGASDITYEVKTRQALSTDTKDTIFPSAGFSYVNTATATQAERDSGMTGGYYTLVKLNKSNNDGTMYYAWQAGIGDSHTRVFQAAVSGTSGYGYFGFGPTMIAGSSAGTLGTIEGMFCAWTNPNQSFAHQIQTGKVQAQSFTNGSLSDGSFGFTPSVNKIAYSPSADCNYDLTQTAYTSSGNKMQVKLAGQTSFSDFNNGQSLTNELISYPLNDNDTTFKTVPVITKPSL